MLRHDPVAPGRRLVLAALALTLMVPLPAVAMPSDRPRPTPAPRGAIPVELTRDEEGRWTLLRGGQPYVVRGAGGAHHHDRVVPSGGNSVRTWGIQQVDALDEDGLSLLDRAHALGLTVTVGIWIHQARHGFKFDDPEAVARQREYVRDAVRRHRDHPAVLMWGLGNEVEIARAGRNPQIWAEMEALARIVREEDPRHPVMTAISGLGTEKLEAIRDLYPSLQVLGINAYGGAHRAAGVLAGIGWDRAWLLTEFGPAGPWESPKTAWGAPIEAPSEDKALRYAHSWETAAADPRGGWLGGYAFIWGHKQEATATWFGMFLTSGERTAAVDTMQHAWTDQWPADRVPVITSWKVPFAEAEVPAGSLHQVRVEASDPEGAVLATTWWVTEEAVRPGIGGDRESAPPLVADAVEPLEAGAARIRIPSRAGPHRLFVKVVDPAGGASVRNTPFLVVPPQP